MMLHAGSPHWVGPNRHCQSGGRARQQAAKGASIGSTSGRNRHHQTGQPLSLQPAGQAAGAGAPAPVLRCRAGRPAL